MEQLEQFLTPSIVSLVILAVYVLAQSVLKKFLPKEYLSTLKTISEIAVMAAEQLAKTGALSPEERKAYALDLIKTELKARKINFNIEVIIAATEAAVLGISKLGNN